MTQTCRACHEPTKDKLWSHYCKACHKGYLKSVSKAKKKNRKRHKKAVAETFGLPAYVTHDLEGYTCTKCGRHYRHMKAIDRHLILKHKFLMGSSKA